MCFLKQSLLKTLFFSTLLEVVARPRVVGVEFFYSAPCDVDDQFGSASVAECSRLNDAVYLVCQRFRNLKGHVLSIIRIFLHYASFFELKLFDRFCNTFSLLSVFQNKVRSKQRKRRKHKARLRIKLFFQLF